MLFCRYRGESENSEKLNACKKYQFYSIIQLVLIVRDAGTGAIFRCLRLPRKQQKLNACKKYELYSIYQLMLFIPDLGTGAIPPFTSTQKTAKLNACKKYWYTSFINSCFLFQMQAL